MQLLAFGSPLTLDVGQVLIEYHGLVKKNVVYLVEVGDVCQLWWLLGHLHLIMHLWLVLVIILVVLMEDLLILNVLAVHGFIYFSSFILLWPGYSWGLVLD